MSEIFDFDTPPFYKNFLVLETNDRGLTVYTYGVSGLERSWEDLLRVETVVCPLPRGAGAEE